MKINTINSQIFIASLLLLGSLLFLTQTVHAAAAGRVVFATGSPQATDTAGAVRGLKRGDEVFSGDTLATAARSRLQISFADGAYISLQPDSQYLIEEYNFAGKQDGTEKANYNLLKGGVRAVTGLIGKQNPEAYKVKTAVATIGIRGTGHNTRICAGDCGNKKDGLYHNTWEGTTTVTNDADSQDVPAGNGVFVEDKDSPIQPLDQPSGVTAVDSTKEKQEEQEEEEERTSLVSTGDQRTGDDGLQIIVVEDEEVIRATGRPEATFSEVISGQVLQAVVPDIDDPDSVDAPLIAALSVFKNADGDPIGFLGLEKDHDDNGNDIRIFATTDLAAVLGGDDASAVAEVESLLDLVTGDELAQFLEKPASVAEFNTVGNGTIGLGRWADGLVFSTDAEADVGLDDLVNNQSIHFVYGPEPGLLTTSGTATYNFIGGTDSTSVSGATIGNGILGGFLAFDFASSQGFVDFDVSHSGTNYRVAGELAIFTADKAFGDSTDGGVRAFTTTAGSACNPSCNTFVEGTFFSPEVNTFPQFAGLEYDIQDTDVVTGVAAFELDTAASPARQVLGGQVLQFVSHDSDPMEVADNGDFFNATLFLDSSNQPVGFIGDETDDNGMIVETFRISAVLDNPSQILEFNMIGNIAIGRWGGGNILASTRNLTNPGTDEDSEIKGFVNNQSLHFVYGPDPGDISGLTNPSAFYNFLAGTQSTSVSGATIGNGVIGGSILVDFSTGNASLSISVDHNSVFYSVSGPLMLDGISIADTGALMATTGTMGSACYSSGCPAFVEGGFAGPLNTSNEPMHLGIGYDIRETDPIIGAAVFYNP